MTTKFHIMFKINTPIASGRDSKIQQETMIQNKNSAIPKILNAVVKTVFKVLFAISILAELVFKELIKILFLSPFPQFKAGRRDLTQGTSFNSEHN